jgi:hypothetical protein
VTVDSSEALVPDEEIPGENHQTPGQTKPSRRDKRQAKANAKAARKAAAEARAVIDVLPMSGSSARALVETGDDSISIPWLRNSLPGLKTRLEAAARSASRPADRLHFAEMTVQVGRLMKASMP